MDHLFKSIIRTLNFIGKTQRRLKLQPKKCEYLRPELEYLGHVITAKGVKPNSRKIGAVLNFKKPSNHTRKTTNGIEKEKSAILNQIKSITTDASNVGLGGILSQDGHTCCYIYQEP